MSLVSDRITELIIKSMGSSLTPEEDLELSTWRASSADNEALYSQLMNRDHMLNEALGTQANKKKIFAGLQKLIPQLDPVRSKVINLSWRYVAAAGIVLLLASTFFFPNKRSTPNALVTTDSSPDKAAPHGLRSTLTLGNGKVIDLDSAQVGSISDQADVRISKNANGEIVYSDSHGKPADVLRNVLSTARGGQTMIMLCDGSKVWLDAASALIYPSLFTGGERRVELTGQAYFEIAPNRSVPFIVHVRNSDIKVLGTQFNVLAYGNEDTVRTTLIDGAVRVVAGTVSALLKPGQQSTVTDAGKLSTLRVADPDQVIAWKNGQFSLDGVDFQSFLKQLERWYDIQVVLDGQPGIELGGTVPRDASLSSVLKVMKTSGVQFKFDGKVLTVSK